MDPDDQLAEHARRLAAAVEAALPGWVERSVRRHHPTASATEAGRAAAADVGAAVRRLLEADVDQQQGNPLALLRGAVHYPTEVLRAAGVAPVDRGRFEQDRFPDDDYDLTPATWADVDPSLHDLGLVWGAAKAFVHKRRHGA